MKVLKELFYKMDRHVPGSREYTLKAAELAGLGDLPEGSKALDAGCAVGNATFILAQNYKMNVAAVDIDGKSLKILEDKAQELNLKDKITTYNKSILDLEFENNYFDVIWSEAVVDNIGFYKAILHLGKFLKPGGKIVISELSWIKDERPDDVFWYWKENYPSMTGIEENLNAMKRAGFDKLQHMVMGKDGFWDNYYKPMLYHMNYFSQKSAKDVKLLRQLEELQTEVDYFVKYGSYYSYVFYIGEKL